MVRRRVRAHAAYGSFLRTLVVLLLAAVGQAGCVTTFGYVPEGVKTKNMSAGAGEGPTYAEVVIWAEDVADGYDSRSTMNRNALFSGAFLGVAGASTLSALALFSSGNPAIAGLPIGTAFVAGIMGFYNNSVRADLYDQASKYVRRLIVMSRASRSSICLEWDVQDVIRKVSRHITLMDPANVVAALRAVKPGDTDEITKLLDSSQGKFSDLEFKPDGSLPPPPSTCPQQ